MGLEKEKNRENPTSWKLHKEPKSSIFKQAVERKFSKLFIEEEAKHKSTYKDKGKGRLYKISKE